MTAPDHAFVPHPADRIFPGLPGMCLTCGLHRSAHVETREEPHTHMTEWGIETSMGAWPPTTEPTGDLMTAENLTRAILQDALQNTLKGKTEPERVYRYAQLLLDLREAMVAWNPMRACAHPVQDSKAVCCVLARADVLLRRAK